MRRFHLLFHSVLSVSVFSRSLFVRRFSSCRRGCPLDLCAGGDALIQTSVTRADNLPEKAFDATVMLTTRQGDYSGLTAKYEGSHGVTVSTDGSVSWKLQSSVQPVYPETGSWLYAVAIFSRQVFPMVVAMYLIHSQARKICCMHRKYVETSGTVTALPGILTAAMTSRWSSHIC